MYSSSFAGNSRQSRAIYADKKFEIDFLVQNGTEIIPVEVKAGEDKSAPSFKRYISERAPSRALRFFKT